MISSDWRGWGQGHSCWWLSRSSVRLVPRGLAAATWSPREPVTERYRRFSTLCSTTGPDHPTTNPYPRPSTLCGCQLLESARDAGSSGRGVRLGGGFVGLVCRRFWPFVHVFASSFPRDPPQLTLSPASAASFTRPDISGVFHSRPSRVGVVRLVSGLGLRRLL